MNTQANALPDAKTAYDNLFQGIHNEVFFRKCAAAGFPARNAQEATWMLETAGKLEAVSEADQVKQAAAQDNPYFQMNSNLDAVLSQYGLGHQKVASAQEVEVGYKQAAAELMQNPTLYNSVLSLAVHEAAKQQEQFQAWQAGQA